MRNREGGQVFRHRALFEGRARGLFRFVRFAAPVQQRCRFGGENLLGVVDLRALQRLQARDFVKGEIGEDFQEPPDIGVFGIAPILPIFVRAEHIRVEPDRALRGLAHLSAGSCGDQRLRQAKQFRVASHAPAEIDAVDDIAPLIGAAHLQAAAVAATQFDEIVCLQHHVIELDEAHRLLAFEPELDAVHRQHAVDRHVPADIAQEVDVIELQEPLGIIDHDGVGLARTEVHEFFEAAADGGGVLRDLLFGEELAHLFLAGRIAHARGAPAEQHDRLAAGLLQPAQEHDLGEIAYMQRRRCHVEADITSDARLRGLVQAGEVSALMKLPALGNGAEEGGVRIGHGASGARTSMCAWTTPSAADRRYFPPHEPFKQPAQWRARPLS